MDIRMDIAAPIRPDGTVVGDAVQVMRAAWASALPDTAVEKALRELPPCSGRLLLLAVGKAAWQMARAAHRVLGARVSAGLVITKHGYGQGPIGGLVLREAGHPVPDGDTYAATAEALTLTEGLTRDDLVLFLLSGGGSALFEKPLVPPEELDRVTRQLLACGADIVEMNTLRKRLSAVKGGRFAQHCAPARVFTVVLSDILGDPLDMIASGPTYPDRSTCEQALAIAEKYGLKMETQTRALLRAETPKELPNAQALVTGSVRQLCDAAAQTCRALGYTPVPLTASLCCQAKEAGSFLASIAQYHSGGGRSLAFIAGGETVVQVTGKGLGGRNQEIALSAAKGIAGLENTAVFSMGSDGTDGPTDAAGGLVTGQTAAVLAQAGWNIDAALRDNDAYHALGAVDGLVFTGPTGTNVNDLSVLLIKR